MGVPRMNLTKSRALLVVAVMLGSALLGGFGLLMTGVLHSGQSDNAGLKVAAVVLGSTTLGACIGQTTCSVGPVNVVAESSLYIILTARSASAIASKNDTYKDTFTQASHGAGTLTETFIYYCDNPVVAANTFMTINFSGSTNYMIGLYDLHNTYTALSLDAHANSTGTAGTASTVSLNTVATGDYLLATVGLSAANAITATAPSVLLGANTPYSTGEGTALQQNATSATSYTVASTFTSANWAESVVAVKPSGLPTAPSSLAVTGETQTHVSLSWTNPHGALLNNTIYYSLGTTPCNVFAVNLSAVVTSATVTGLVSGQQYCFEVTAWNATGKSAASNQVIQTTNQKPPAPTSLIVTGETQTHVSLSWTNATGGGVTNDSVFYSNGTTPCNTHAVNVHPAATSVTITGLAAGNQYCFEVVAYNATGASPPSNSVTQVTNSKPATPTGLAVVSTTVPSIGSATVVLTWVNPTTPGAGLVNNTVFYTTGATWCAVNATQHKNTHGAFDNATLTGLMPFIQYCAVVEVWNATGQSSLSSKVVFWTNTTPLAVNTLNGSALNSASIYVAWVNPVALTQGTDPGLTNDSIFVGPTCGSGSAYTGFNLGVVTFVTITGLAPGTAYNITVYAWNATGHGPAVACIVVTTAIMCPTSGYVGALIFGSIGLLAVAVLLGGGGTAAVVHHVYRRKRFEQ